MAEHEQTAVVVRAFAEHLRLTAVEVAEVALDEELVGADRELGVLPRRVEADDVPPGGRQHEPGRGVVAGALAREPRVGERDVEQPVAAEYMSWLPLSAHEPKRPASAASTGHGPRMLRRASRRVPEK